jgi:hypothetical protein
VDQPFLDAQGRCLENLTRVETFGDNAFKTDPASDYNNVHRLKVFVDARSREVFFLPTADRAGKPCGGACSVDCCLGTE